MKEKIQIVKDKISNLISKINNKHRSVMVIIEIIIALSLGGLLLSMLAHKDWDANKIVSEMKNDLPGLALLETPENSQATLPDAMVSTASFTDIVIQTEDTFHPFAGCVEVFNNNQEALLRKEYLELQSEKIVSEISAANFGSQICAEYKPGKEHIYVNGNVLLRLDSQYSNYQAEQISKSFHRVLENDKQTEKNIPDAAALETARKDFETRAKEAAEVYKNQLLEKLEGEINDLAGQIEGADLDGLLAIIEKAQPYKSVPVISQQAVDVINAAQDKIQVAIQEVEDGLAYAWEVLEQEALDDVKAKIDALEHAYYDTYKTQWNQETADIQWAINEKIIREYKAQCTAYEYDDILADVDGHTGAYAYFRGKVVEVTETSGGVALRVNVTPVYSYFTDTILYWEDSIYVDVDGDIATEVYKDNLVEMWGVIDGTTTHSTLFGGDQTVLKFSCRYLELN